MTGHWYRGWTMLELGQSHGSAFARSWHRLPYGPGNSGFITTAPLTERTRKAGTWTVYKGGQMVSYAAVRLHQRLYLHLTRLADHTNSRQWLYWFSLVLKFAFMYLSSGNRHGACAVTVHVWQLRWCSIISSLTQTGLLLDNVPMTPESWQQCPSTGVQ